MPDVYYDAQAVGADNGTSWADAFTTLLAAIAATGAGDLIYQSHTSNEILGVSPIYTGTGQRIVSVDKTGSVPPVAADYIKGGTFTAATQDIILRGLIHSIGTLWKVGDDFISDQAVSNIVLEDGSLELTGASDSFRLIGGSVRLIDFDLIVGIATNFISVLGTGIFLHWRGGTVVGAMNTLFANVSGGDIIIEGVDLSSVTVAIVTPAVTPGYFTIIFKGCVMPSGVPLSSIAVPIQGLIAAYGSSDTNKPYFMQEEQYEGTIITETTNVKSGGSSDGTTPISLKFVSNANVSEYAFALKNRMPILFYAADTGVQEFIVDVMTDGVTLQDDEIYLEFSSPGTGVQRVMTETRPLNPLVIPSNLTASAAMWDESGIGAAVKQKITASIDPKQKGWMECFICLAKPLTTMYADVKVFDGNRQYLAGQAYINGEAAACDCPIEDNVKDEVVYDFGARTGNRTDAPEDKVENKFKYGPNGTGFIGTLIPTHYELPEEIILEDEEIIIFEECN